MIYMQPDGFLHRAGLLHCVHASMHGFPPAFLLLASFPAAALASVRHLAGPGRRLGEPEFSRRVCVFIRDGGEDFPREGDKHRVRFISRLSFPILLRRSFHDGLIKKWKERERTVPAA
jgi:hypothetical protein